MFEFLASESIEMNCKELCIDARGDNLFRFINIIKDMHVMDILQLYD